MHELERGFPFIGKGVSQIMFDYFLDCTWVRRDISAYENRAFRVCELLA